MQFARLTRAHIVSFRLVTTDSGYPTDFSNLTNICDLPGHCPHSISKRVLILRTRWMADQSKRLKLQKTDFSVPRFSCLSCPAPGHTPNSSLIRDWGGPRSVVHVIRH